MLLYAEGLLCVVVLLVPGRSMDGNTRQIHLDINEYVKGLDMLPPVSKNAEVRATCDTNLSLPADLSFIWKDSDNRFLNESKMIQLYTAVDKEHRSISLTIEENYTYVYIMCIDPVSRNVIRGFQIQHNVVFEPLYKKNNTHTICPIDSGHMTIINCRDMFIPPVVVDTCRWTNSSHPQYNPSGSSIKVLETVPGYENVTWYTCECGQQGIQGPTRLMNFSTPAATGDERDTADYQLCQHLPKYLAPYFLPLNTTGPQTNSTTESPETQQNTAAIVLGVLFAVTILVLVPALVITCKRLRRGNEAGGTATDGAGDTMLQEIHRDT